MLTKRKPVHPGNLFKEEVLIPLGLTVTQAAAGLGVSRKALSEFLNGHSSLSPEMAIRIGKATKTSPESWLNMQTKLNLWKVEKKNPEVIPFPIKANDVENKDEQKSAII
ncbi:MAG: HigA family addiction module antidote protein [Actinobacteria bacterium]|nr:HigA family addiction module antidote protein [Actinomycetota bacterium]MCG2789676.1 HigA family addiction module antitoxin [Actinomycetes bacterium]